MLGTTIAFLPRFEYIIQNGNTDNIFVWSLWKHIKNYIPLQYVKTRDGAKLVLPAEGESRRIGQRGKNGRRRWSAPLQAGSHGSCRATCAPVAQTARLGGAARG